MAKKKLTKKEKLRRHKLTKTYLETQQRKLNKKEFNKKLKQWKLKVLLRDNMTCQKCGEDLNKFTDKGKEKQKHPHHIVSLESVKHTFPDLLEDVDNGILLCARCHKYSHDSAHQSPLEFSEWFRLTFPDRYEYLTKRLNLD